MSKEVIIVRKKGKVSEVFVNEKKILPAKEFPKPNDQVVINKENIIGADEVRSKINVLETFETRERKKTGSIQQRIRSTIPKEKKTKKMEAYAYGSYYPSGLDYTERAEGEIYRQDEEKNPEYYKSET